MTYLMQSTPTRRRQSPMVRRYGRRHRSLQGLEALGADFKECDTRADADHASLFAKANDLAKNWNPTGYYTPDEVTEVVRATYAVLQQASDVLDQTDKEIPQRDWGGEESGYAHSIGLKRADLHRKFREGTVFVDAVREAKAQGIQLLDVTGLKRWVVNSMLDAASSIYASSLLMCIMPWWMGALGAMAEVFEHLVEIAKLIGAALKRAGQIVLKVPDTIGTLLTVAKWTLLLGIPAYMLYKLRGARSAP